MPRAAGYRRTVDGPRTDVSDTSDFVYYPVDPAVPAALRGRLAAARNPAGHVTRYEDHDLFGNPRRVIDPNGVVEERTYDALGRLATSTLLGTCVMGTGLQCPPKFCRTD